MCASTLYNTANAASRAAGCDLDASAWNIGSRTQWNVTNKVGDKLASGIYLIHVKDMKGRGEAVRKVAVVK